MKVSVLITAKESNDFLRESLDMCKRLQYRDFEIIVLPDKEFLCHDEKIKIIPTGACLPAKKRDIGLAHANGDILAFLDDDAYPKFDWLTNAIKNFKDSQIAAVGGPAVTPPDENFLRKASGHVYESLAVSGSFRYRYISGRKMLVDDYPSCNLLVRKSILQQLGGFKIDFWPGEDTFLCREITKRLNKKIIYEPEALVYHHRRPLFKEHLKQIKNYGLHRGYFAKRFPETSLRWQYFMPSFFLILLLFGLIFSLFNMHFRIFYLFLLFSYAVFVIVNAYQDSNFKMTLLVSMGIFLTHITYGLYLILGLLKPRLNEEVE